jgi:hypothetical protein
MSTVLIELPKASWNGQGENRLRRAKTSTSQIRLNDGTNALMAAVGVGLVEGQSHEWPAKEKVEARELAASLGFDVDEAGIDGLTALHGAANRVLTGRTRSPRIVLK